MFKRNFSKINVLSISLALSLTSALVFADQCPDLKNTSDIDKAKWQLLSGSLAEHNTFRGARWNLPLLGNRIICLYTTIPESPIPTASLISVQSNLYPELGGSWDFKPDKSAGCDVYDISQCPFMILSQGKNK